MAQNHAVIFKNSAWSTDGVGIRYVLIRRLGLHDVRLVGQSAGAFVALAFALKHPSLVHSLALSEPPAHQLVRNTSEGEAVYQDFVATVMIPAAIYFRQNDMQHAMKIFVNGMAATSVTIPGAGHGSPRENASAFNEAVLGFFLADTKAN
jgi:pimeloyl-ACP methyl ester carboxylesterase